LEPAFPARWGKPDDHQQKEIAMLKKSLINILLLVMFLMGCTPQATTPASQRIFNVGMLLGSGGLGDRSFNDSAYAGLQAAQKKFNIRFEAIPYTSEEANLDGLRRMSRQGYDLIIDIGSDKADIIRTLAKEFPECKFALVDATLAEDMDNVTSIVWREQEGDFLMGALAAMLTHSKQVGFIGGTDIAIIRRIESGLRQGVAYQDGSVSVVANLAGTWSDSEAGKALARQQYQSGVDVIYNAAGRTGLGVIEAAQEANQLTLGTSGDQRYLAPDNMVGNRPKRVDVAVLMLIEALIQDRFQPGLRSLGLKEGGLALGPFNETLVTAAMLKRLDELKQKIMAGEIVIQVPAD
jgi:basic membrane protein A and related proteins